MILMMSRARTFWGVYILTPRKNLSGVEHRVLTVFGLMSVLFRDQTGPKDLVPPANLAQHAPIVALVAIR
jgi:hypothetical protein